MKKTSMFVLALALAIGLPIAPATTAASPAPAGQGPPAPPAGLWEEVAEASIATRRAERPIVPRAYRVFRLDESLLAAALSRAPLEQTAAAREGPGVVVTLPMPDGKLERFRVQESPIMEPALAARFPDIRTYNAQGIDDPAATVRFDRTPAGFHAMVLSPNGTVFVDPYRKNDTAHYIAYYKRDFVKEFDGFRCLTPDTEGDAKGEPGTASLLAAGEALRTYRMALACTGEYAQFHGGTVDGAFAAMTTTMNRVNGVFEIDVAVRMVFVANNTSLIFLNGATDPYTNNNVAVMRGQNQTTVDNIIGSANYDIGHVLARNNEGGIVGGIGSVCTNGLKAQGATGLPEPVGDPFDIDFFAHEVGHQFGGTHTYNSCFGPGTPTSTAYEIGSGSTIMAYAGTCGSTNLQPNSDPYFHGHSISQILAYTAGGGSCAAQTPTGNLPPVVAAGPTYTIPVSTPFELTATGSDPNGDGLTYCWEQFDLGPSNNGTVDNGSSPIFRSFIPTASPTRTFPKVSTLVNNTSVYGEVLPTTSRTMNFRVTARDNRAGGGGTAFSATQVTSTTTAGPFTVTAPNAGGAFAGGTPLAVTWNVANTNVAPVNTANVAITLSLDGGLTFPIVLNASTPNDGSETVTLPSVSTASARVKVKGAGNVFFDISNANFSISSPATGGDSLGIFSSSAAAYFLRNSNTPGNADATFFFGAAPSALTPLRGDWNGDRSDTIGLYDPATGAFFLKFSNASGPADLAFFYGPGGAGWLPITGDWNGDGIDTIGLYDPGSGFFFLRNSNDPGPADVVYSFGPGGAGFLPLAGDWDGNLTDTVAIYSPATGTFFLRNSHAAGSADLAFTFGVGGATPLAGDWNLDGKDTVGLYVPATGTWFLRNTNDAGPADAAAVYGPPDALPLVGDWDAL